MALRVKDRERLQEISNSIGESIRKIYEIQEVTDSLTDARSVQNQREKADIELTNISTQQAALNGAIDEMSKPARPPATPTEENGEGETDGDDN